MAAAVGIVIVLLPHFAFGDEVVRRVESNAQFSIKVQGPEIAVKRKVGGTATIHGVLWGEPPSRKILPTVMLNKASSVLLVPMADYSYQLIDLEKLVEHPNEKGEWMRARLEGGTLKTKSYDSSPIYWRLERLIGTNLIYGQAVGVDDKAMGFFIDLERSILVVKGTTPPRAVMCREISSDTEEKELRVVANTAEYESLARVMTK